MDHLLTAQVEPRFFHGPHVPEGGVRPQLIVEGVPFPDFIRAALQTQGLAAQYGVVEDGPLRFDRQRWAAQVEEFRAPGPFSQRSPEAWNIVSLHVCECGDAGCYATTASVVPFTYEGQPGLLIDKCWCRASPPYPVPSVFIPDNAWIKPASTPVLPADALQPTPLLTYLLGGNVHALLQAYEDARKPAQAEPDSPTNAETAFARLFGGPVHA